MPSRSFVASHSRPGSPALCQRPSTSALVVALHESDGLSKASPPKAHLRTAHADAMTAQHVKRMQSAVAAIPYTCNGPSYNVDKGRPLEALLQTGRSIRHGRRAIQCVEAVLLALSMSQGMLEIERFGLSFRALETATGKINRHLVLGVYAAGRFGAIGRSREPGLMNKPLSFSSLADMVLDFQKAWAESSHVLQNITLSRPILHNNGSTTVRWEYICLDISNWSNAAGYIAQYQHNLEACTLKPVLHRTVWDVLAEQVQHDPFQLQKAMEREALWKHEELADTTEVVGIPSGWNEEQNDAQQDITVDRDLEVYCSDLTSQSPDNDGVPPDTTSPEGGHSSPDQPDCAESPLHLPTIAANNADGLVSEELTNCCQVTTSSVDAINAEEEEVNGDHQMADGISSANEQCGTPLEDSAAVIAWHLSASEAQNMYVLEVATVRPNEDLSPTKEDAAQDAVMPSGPIASPSVPSSCTTSFAMDCCSMDIVDCNAQCVTNGPPVALPIQPKPNRSPTSATLNKNGHCQKTLGRQAHSFSPSTSKGKSPSRAPHPLGSSPTRSYAGVEFTKPGKATTTANRAQSRSISPPDILTRKSPGSSPVRRTELHLKPTTLPSYTPIWSGTASHSKEASRQVGVTPPRRRPSACLGSLSALLRHSGTCTPESSIAGELNMASPQTTSDRNPYCSGYQWTCSSSPTHWDASTSHEPTAAPQMSNVLDADDQYFLSSVRHGGAGSQPTALDAVPSTKTTVTQVPSRKGSPPPYRSAWRARPLVGAAYSAVAKALSLKERNPSASPTQSKQQSGCMSRVMASLSFITPRSSHSSSKRSSAPSQCRARTPEPNSSAAMDTRRSSSLPTVPEVKRMSGANATDVFTGSKASGDSPTPFAEVKKEVVKEASAGYESVNAIPAEDDATEVDVTMD